MNLSYTHFTETIRLDWLKRGFKYVRTDEVGVVPGQVFPVTTILVQPLYDSANDMKIFEIESDSAIWFALNDSLTTAYLVDLRQS